MKRILPLFLLLGINSLANAADGTINFTGTIINPPCTLELSDSMISVPLGDYTTDALAVKGTETTAKNFEIVLTGCSTEEFSAVQTRFNFNEDSTDGRFISINGPDSASGVAIKLMDEEGTLISPNTESKAVLLEDGAPLRLSFKASYISTADTVGKGSANANGTFELLYQ